MGLGCRHRQMLRSHQPRRPPQEAEPPPAAQTPNPGMGAGGGHGQGAMVPDRGRNPARRSPLPSYNIAKQPLEFSTSIPRERLRASYGQGFRGAPLQSDTSTGRSSQNRPGGHRGTTRTPSKKTPRGPRAICSQSPRGGLSGRRLRAAGADPPPHSLSRPPAPVGGSSQPATLYSKKEAVMKSLPVAIYARVSSDQQTDA